MCRSRAAPSTPGSSSPSSSTPKESGSMVEPYLRRTPLTHLGLAAKTTADTANAEIVMGERPHHCQINVRGNADDPHFTDALHSVTGLRLPTEANSFTTESALAC